MTLADWITSLRIILIVPITLALSAEAAGLALACYLAVACSDFLDGWAARRYGAGKRGAQFDAAADLAFGAAIVCWALWKLPGQRGWIAVYLPLILSLFAAYSLVCYRKVGQVLLLHLWTGKLAGSTGVLWFGLAYFAGAGLWPLHLTAILLVLFYAESLVFVMKGRRDLDGRSAFLPEGS